MGANNLAPAAIPVIAAPSQMGTTISQVGSHTGTNALQQMIPTLPALPVTIPGLPLAQKVQSLPGLLTVVAICVIAMVLTIAPRRRRRRKPPT